MGIQYHKSMGKVVYDPKRPGMRKRTRASGANTLEWWCVLQVDREITRYYRWWVERHFWGLTAVQPGWLCQPSWEGHISIVRGEMPYPRYQHLWRKYHGVKVEFEYGHAPFMGDAHETRYAQDGEFWMIPVRCPLIDHIRDELGLLTHHDYHLTVGRTYYGR